VKRKGANGSADDIVARFVAAGQTKDVRCSTCKDKEVLALVAAFGERKKAGATHIAWRSFWRHVLLPIRPDLRYCTMLNHVRNCMDG